MIAIEIIQQNIENITIKQVLKTTLFKMKYFN